MSDRYEPSYYEIALTGRQAMGAFVFLLGLLLVAFFAGLWVGHGDGADEATPDSGEVVAEVGSGPVLDPDGDGPAGGDGGEDAVEGDELTFFEEDPGSDDGTADAAAGDRGADSRPVPRPRVSDDPSTTLAQDLAVEERDPEPRRPPADRETNEGETSGRSPTGRPSEDTSPEEASPEEPTAEPASEASDDPASARTSGDLVIQVLVTGDRAKAEAMLEQLEDKSFRAFLSPLETADRGTLYRVRIGPFERQEDAERVEQRVQRELGLDTWITQ